MDNVEVLISQLAKIRDQYCLWGEVSVINDTISLLRKQQLEIDRLKREVRKNETDS